MSLYFYSLRKLSESELIAIDKEVKRNREFIYTIVKKLPLNAKRKGKICLYVIFMSKIAQPLAPCVCNVSN
jgi:hypothetical protein